MLRTGLVLTHAGRIHESLATAVGEQAWKYQPWVQEAIDKRLDKLADVTPPSIGFHVRWGSLQACQCSVSHPMHGHRPACCNAGVETNWQRTKCW
jgi:hypothetical protein